ncbi:hypothetical protein [Streptomyces sp. NPDC102282]|uniref:hypothetical protein n=1 Tax=Streptomyces sp. NPDC102282 TaxID=3366154 RepID=UPI003810857E
MTGGHGAALDECRPRLHRARSHSWTPVTAVVGTEFRMKDDKGAIGLFVFRTKSTAPPDLA